MKLTHALVAAVATISLAACAVPEDDGKTAADRVETKDAAKKDAKPAATSTEKAKPPKPEKPAETAGQTQARASAEQYLDYSAFSRSGLIEQLEFEGFSTKDATYGTEAQHANWNDQAALAAKEYLDYSSFSRAGLIEQLTFEGYTPQQAEFGVNKVGL
jgi:hypothetical protein